jgi:hypothetical protein
VRRESRCYKIFLFQRYLSFLHQTKRAPRHIGCIHPQPPHRRLRQLIVFQEQRCISSGLWDQLRKTLVQQLQREPKVHLYDPRLSSQ